MVYALGQKGRQTNIARATPTSEPYPSPLHGSAQARPTWRPLPPPPTSPSQALQSQGELGLTLL